MRKITSIISAAAILLPFALPSAAFAQINACPQGSQFSGLCALTAGNIGPTVGAAVTFVFVISALIALAYLIWGGIKWIISQGDKTGVESARNHIIAAIIGLVLIFLSYLVINLVLSFFANGASLTNLTLPQLPAQ